MQADVLQSLQNGHRRGWRCGQVVTHRKVSVLVRRVGHNIGLSIVGDEGVLSIDRLPVMIGIHGLQDSILSGLRAIFELITALITSGLVMRGLQRHNQLTDNGICHCTPRWIPGKSDHRCPSPKQRPLTGQSTLGTS